MRSLRLLIEDEHFAMAELEGCESRVKYYEDQLSICDSDSYDYEFYEKKHDEAIADRYNAMEKLNSVRKELKKHLVDIMENY